MRVVSILFYSITKDFVNEEFYFVKICYSNEEIERESDALLNVLDGLPYFIWSVDMYWEDIYVSHFRDPFVMLLHQDFYHNEVERSTLKPILGLYEEYTKSEDNYMKIILNPIDTEHIIYISKEKYMKQKYIIFLKTKLANTMMFFSIEDSIEVVNQKIKSSDPAYVHVVECPANRIFVNEEDTERYYVTKNYKNNLHVIGLFSSRESIMQFMFNADYTIVFATLPSEEYFEHVFSKALCAT